MGKRTGPLSEISADAVEISASGREYSHMNTPSRLPGSKMLKCACVEGITVLDFSNFQVNISINVKFHPGRMKTIIWTQEKFIPLSGQLGYRDHVNGPWVSRPYFEWLWFRTDGFWKRLAPVVFDQASISSTSAENALQSTFWILVLWNAISYFLKLFVSKILHFILLWIEKTFDHLLYSDIILQEYSIN